MDVMGEHHFAWPLETALQVRQGGWRWVAAVTQHLERPFLLVNYSCIVHLCSLHFEAAADHYGLAAV